MVGIDRATYREKSLLRLQALKQDRAFQERQPFERWVGECQGIEVHCPIGPPLKTKAIQATHCVAHYSPVVKHPQRAILLWGMDARKVQTNPRGVAPVQKSRRSAVVLHHGKTTYSVSR